MSKEIEDLIKSESIRKTRKTLSVHLAFLNLVTQEKYKEEIHVVNAILSSICIDSIIDITDNYKDVFTKDDENEVNNLRIEVKRYLTILKSFHKVNGEKLEQEIKEYVEKNKDFC